MSVKFGDTVLTRGDNNTIVDEPINISKIEGKVYYHSLVLGEIFIYWIKPILSLIIVSLFIGNIKKYVISKEKKR